MMHIRVVHVRVGQRRMHVGVGMGFVAIPCVVGVLMVFVERSEVVCVDLGGLVRLQADQVTQS